MSARIRYTDEDEVIARAGTEEATVLDDEGASEFPRNPEPAKREINRGTGGLTGSGTFAESKAIAHGLGTTPTVVILTSHHRSFNFATNPSSFNGTTFTVSGRGIDSTFSGEETFSWIAMS